MFTATMLLKRWKVAVVQEKESRAYFEELCASVGPEKTKEWVALEARMQIEREDNIRVMDQLDVAERKGESHHYVRCKL